MDSVREGTDLAGEQYSEQQLALILQRAAELSATDDRRYSLDEIQRIAEQAGIAPELVAQAAAALPVPDPEQPTWLWGAPSASQLVRRVDRVVQQSEFAAALSLLRQRLGQTGDARDVGGTLEWRYDTGYSAAAVTIAPDKDGTTVRIDGRADGRQFMLPFGAIAAALFTGLVASKGMTMEMSALIAAGSAVPYLAIARLWWNRSARASREKLARVADEVAGLLSRG